MEEAVVVASCPSKHQDVVSYFCKKRGFQKAFGRVGDMVDTLSGDDWVAKWEAKVAMATVTKAETLGATKAKIICVSGGEFCDLELSRQPLLVKAIKQEMQDDAFRVRVEWLEFEEFMESYGDGFNNQKQNFATNASNGQDTGTNWRSGQETGNSNSDNNSNWRSGQNTWNNSNWHSGQDTWNDTNWRGGQDTGNNNRVDNNTNYRSEQDGGAGNNVKANSKVTKGQENDRKQDADGATKSGTGDNKTGKGGGKSGKGKDTTEKSGKVKDATEKGGEKSEKVKDTTEKGGGKSGKGKGTSEQQGQPESKSGAVGNKEGSKSGKSAGTVEKQESKSDKDKDKTSGKSAKNQPSSENKSSEVVKKPTQQDTFPCHACGRSFASDVALRQHWKSKPECAGGGGIATSLQQEERALNTRTKAEPASEEPVTDEKQTNKGKDKTSAAKKKAAKDQQRLEKDSSEVVRIPNQMEGTMNTITKAAPAREEAIADETQQSMSNEGKDKTSAATHQPTQHDIYQCHTCGRTFASAVALRQHWQSRPECTGAPRVATSPQQEASDTDSGEIVGTPNQEEGTMITSTKAGRPREEAVTDEKQANTGRNRTRPAKKAAAKDQQHSEKDSGEIVVGTPNQEEGTMITSTKAGLAREEAVTDEKQANTGKNKTKAAKKAAAKDQQHSEKDSAEMVGTPNQEEGTIITSTKGGPARVEAVRDEKQANTGKNRTRGAKKAAAQDQQLSEKDSSEVVGIPNPDRSCFSSSPEDFFADAVRESLEVLKGFGASCVPWSVAVERVLLTRAKFEDCSQEERLTDIKAAEKEYGHRLDPDELLGCMQRCIDRVYGLFFQWACALRRQGADFDLNRGKVIVLACDCGARGREFKTVGSLFECNVCREERRWVRVTFVKDAPAETVHAVGVLDCQFKIALANLGMLPTVRHSWCPFLVVAAAAQCSFMESLGGTPVPALLPGLASAIPSHGPLRDLDDLAFDVASAFEKDDAGEVSCKLCFRRFPSIRSLERHRSFDHSQEALNFLCPWLH